MRWRTWRAAACSAARNGEVSVRRSRSNSRAIDEDLFATSQRSSLRTGSDLPTRTWASALRHHAMASRFAIDQRQDRAFHSDFAPRPDSNQALLPAGVTHDPVATEHCHRRRRHRRLVCGKRPDRAGPLGNGLRASPSPGRSRSRRIHHAELRAAIAAGGNSGRRSRSGAQKSATGRNISITTEP